MLNNEKLTENKVSSIPSKVTEGSEPQSSTSGKVLILHGPDNLNSLKEFLSKISPVTSISRMEPAPIMATIANISIFKSRLKSGKLMFHGKELDVIPVERVEDANKGMQPTKTLFVGGIPKSMTIEQLKSQLPNNCQPVSLNLLNKNPKINSAFMSFSSIDVAKQAHQIFSSLTVEGQLFKANFAKDQQPRAGPDGSVRVAVSNWDGHPNQLRKLFPTCLDVQWIQKKRKAFLKFPSLEVRKAAVSQPKFHAGKQLKLALTGGPELKTAIVWGFPADTKESDIKGLFGGVVSVSRDTTTGNQSASMTVEFETAADCNNAISSNATLKGRRVTIFLKDVFVDDCANNQQKHSGPSEKKAKPVEVGVSKVKTAHKVSKAEEVNDADDIEDENDDEEDEGTSEDGDDSDEDDESEDESEEEEDGSEDESDEDVDMVSPKGKEKKQFPGLHDKKLVDFRKQTTVQEIKATSKRSTNLVVISSATRFVVVVVDFAAAVVSRLTVVVDSLSVVVVVTVGAGQNAVVLIKKLDCSVNPNCK
ncbi:transcriptional regulator, variant 4 [Schistosoma haematobium]|uniref:Transcriptional regulator, variant 4 n=1 Tax=Schistosoma haematobium TaxID=6185 RepID=A0A922LQA9_SCHHA|nr:transcriptional regulator, variant 4 [Schistosoma haematobium]KAH9591342.1 transcriptional regulator, variant 4 [Schistosoma haematobium]